MSDSKGRPPKGRAPAPATKAADDPAGQGSRAPATRAAGADAGKGSRAPATRAAGADAGTGSRAPATRAPGADATQGSHIFVALPPVLAAVFEPVRELPGGGEGSLVLCRRRSGGQQVVVKIYRQQARSGVADPREALRSLDPKHAVQYVEPYFGTVDGHWWEVVEYCAEGSLGDMVAGHRGGLPPAVLRDIVREVATALEHLHSRKPMIVHRDVKPGNILVRTRSPLDLVLADFGLAVLMDLSRERRSGSRTMAYAAPEAAGGETSPALDWWGLGMTVAELAGGRHPYELPDGTWLTDAQILSEVSTRPVPLTRIRDDRVLRLVRGLLTRNPEHRWGAPQVMAWLEGGAPVVRDEADAPVAVTTRPAGRPAAGGARRAGTAPTAASSAAAPSGTGARTTPTPAAAAARRVSPFPFAGTAYTDPAALARAMAASWTRAAEIVVGRDFGELVAWTEEHFPEQSLEAVLRGQARRQQSVDRTVAEIVAQLDPTGRPVFMGVPVDRAGLRALVGDLDDAAEDVVDKLFRSRALLAYAALDGHGDLALVEAQWQDFCTQAEKWFTTVKQAGSMTPGARAAILLAALDEVDARKAS